MILGRWQSCREGCRAEKDQAEEEPAVVCCMGRLLGMWGHHQEGRVVAMNCTSIPPAACPSLSASVGMGLDPPRCFPCL